MVKDQFYPETWRDQKVGRGVARFDSQKVARRLKDEEDEKLKFFFLKQEMKQDNPNTNHANTINPDEADHKEHSTTKAPIDKIRNKAHFWTHSSIMTKTLLKSSVHNPSPNLIQA